MFKDPSAHYSAERIALVLPVFKLRYHFEHMEIYLQPFLYNSDSLHLA